MRENGDRTQPSASGPEVRREQDPAAAAGADHPADTPCPPQAARSDAEGSERPAEQPIADSTTASDAAPASPPAETGIASAISGAPRRLRRRRSKRQTPPVAPAGDSGAANHPATPESLRPGG